MQFDILQLKYGVINKLDYNWTFAYQIGIETLDNEHRLFLSLIKKLKFSEHGQQEMQAFNELIRYIRYHFESEEDLMKVHNYSKFEEHKGAHFKLLDRITEFLTEIEMGTFNKEELLIFLIEWFSTHTTGMDKHFSMEISNESK